MPQRFTFEPTPPTENQPVTIRYNFDGPPPATDPVEVKIIWGNGNTETVELSRAEPEVTRDVPKPCLSIVVTDLSGQSTDAGVAVNPG